MSDHDRLARVALSRLTEPGDLRIAGLVEELGAVRLHELLSSERDVGDVLTDVAARLADIDPERDLERAARLGIRYVVPRDDEWPVQLADLQDAEPLGRAGGLPLGLWVRGPLRLHELPRSVAVVGARSATTYGAEAASTISQAVVRSGWGVVSGAAFGIDVAAHRGALAAGGPTVAVLACGVDRAYPKAHTQLLDHLSEHGAVVSELAPGCAPTRLRFLTRNRLIAALCRGTVVVEAAVRSGALNTASWTTRLNRSLMAVPGPITSAPSEGAHQLIRSGAATLVTSGSEVLEVLGAAGEHLLDEPRGPVRQRDQLDRRRQQVLEAVPVSRRATADSIARTAGLGLLEVRTALGHLEGLGLVSLAGEGWRLA
jgi:DNA processing protein